MNSHYVHSFVLCDIGDAEASSKFISLSGRGLETLTIQLQHGLSIVVQSEILSTGGIMKRRAYEN